MSWWPVLIAVLGAAVGWPMSSWVDRFDPARQPRGTDRSDIDRSHADHSHADRSHADHSASDGGDGSNLPATEIARPQPSPDIPAHAVGPAGSREVAVHPGPARAARPPARWQRAVLAGAAGLLSGAVALRVGWSWELPAALFLVLLAVLLSAIDLTHRRLPNVLVLPAIPLLGLLLVPAAFAAGDPAALLRALAASAALFAGYLIPALISPRSMGMGDVKLAALLGLPLGFLGWPAVMLGTLLAFVGGAVAAGWLLLSGRARRGAAMPFGPCMLAATVGVVLLAAP